MSQFETPMLTKATRNTASVAAKRMSQPSASASPKPAAGPLTAAITGCGSARSASTSRDMCCWLARRSRDSSLPSLPGRGP